MGLFDRLQRGWNAFIGRDPTRRNQRDYGSSYSYRPDRPFLKRDTTKSIVSAIYTRFAVDAASVGLLHVRLDWNERFLDEVDSGLNRCLTLSANIDQTSRDFMIDAILSMFDEGVVALTPIDTDRNPDDGSFDIESMRVGRIKEWYSYAVKVEAWNEIENRKGEIICPKRTTAIVENPFYAIMNAPNSTAQRLAHKLALLDQVDDSNSSGKLDLIIQLPYSVKTPQRKDIAESRRKEIETQLTGSKYGIAYIDGTEKITQLNRAVENNLLAQVEYLTNQLYSQLGISPAILDGTADEQEMINYYNRIIEPILSAFALEMKRKFLTQTARTQRQSIEFFRDPFRLIPAAQMAEIADKMTRNEILTGNEIRQIIGYRPSEDPKADELRNKNLNPEDPYANLTEEDIAAIQEDALMQQQNGGLPEEQQQ